MQNFHYYVQEQYIQFVEVVHQLQQEIYHDNDFEMEFDLLTIYEVEKHKHLENSIKRCYKNDFNSEEFFKRSYIPAIGRCTGIFSIACLNNNSTITIRSRFDIYRS